MNRIAQIAHIFGQTVHITAQIAHIISQNSTYNWETGVKLTYNCYFRGLARVSIKNMGAFGEIKKNSGLLMLISSGLYLILFTDP